MIAGIDAQGEGRDATAIVVVGPTGTSHPPSWMQRAWLEDDGKRHWLFSDPMPESFWTVTKITGGGFPKRGRWTKKAQNARRWKRPRTSKGEQQ